MIGTSYSAAWLFKNGFGGTAHEVTAAAMFARLDKIDSRKLYRCVIRRIDGDKRVINEINIVELAREAQHVA